MKMETLKINLGIYRISVENNKKQLGSAHTPQTFPLSAIQENYLLKIKSGKTIEAIVMEHAFLGTDRISKVLDPLKRQIMVRTPGFEAPVGVLKEKIFLTWDIEDTWSVGAT